MENNLLSQLFSTCNQNVIVYLPLNQKMGRRSKETFLQRRQTDGQKTHDKTHKL